MKKTILLSMSILCTHFLIAQDSPNVVINQIDKLLDSQLSKENVHNVFLSLYSPSYDFEWHIAKGMSKDGKEVSTKNPFYTASIGKTFTATAIGILVDKKKIRFDDPISKYLSDQIMSGLHIMDGVDYGDSIKVSHLLQHTSGLPDYFSRETVDGSPSIFDLIMTEPDRYWEPEELVAFAKAHFKPAFAPGKGYYYTDTEYVLLGLIIEEISHMELHDFFKKHIFIPLKMNHTYLNQRSAPILPTEPMAEMYAGEHEIRSFRSLSADWAGGAIVSTGKDLITFLYALMKNKLVAETTLNDMKHWVPETLGMSYGYGLRKIDLKQLNPSLPEWILIGHSGLNGTFMYYCPSMDLYLAGTLNQLEASREAVNLMIRVLLQYKQL